MPSQLAMDIPELQSCDTCRWYVEIVGLGRPHPERCMYHNAVRDAKMLDTLPGSRWCMYYKEDKDA